METTIMRVVRQSEICVVQRQKTELTLRFGTHQYEDRVFQDAIVTDIVKV